MSADAWIICPKCKEPNWDCVPAGEDPTKYEYGGLMRVDFEIGHSVGNITPIVRLDLWCTHCNYNKHITEKDIFSDLEDGNG